MKLSLCISILAMVSVPFASGQSKQAQEATIMSIQQEDVITPLVRTGASPVRTPLESHYSLYTISVRLNCTEYVGRYETELDDLPSALAPNNSVPVRLEKHVMYLDFPGDSVRMKIVNRNVKAEGDCRETAVAK
jgi:hypothetical protein